MERLSLGCCQVCNSTFRIGDAKLKRNWTNLTRENLKAAFEENKGVMFWNREVAERKHRLGLRVSPDGSTHERRFICPDCIEHLYSRFELSK